jgi:signal transduction histidine kinase
MEHPIRPGRFRWRLTIAFVLVAGLSAGVLAVAAFFMTSAHREDAFVERSVREARFSLSLAEDTLPQSPSQEDVRRLISRLKRRQGFDTLVRSNGNIHSSNPEIDASHIPRELMPTAAAVETAITRIERDVYLIAASRLPDSESEFYFLFSKKQLSEGLSSLRTILLWNWTAVVLLAGLIGSTLARRTLRPVSRASHAARSLAEGLLNTRLPVDTKDEFGTWAASFNEMADALQKRIDDLSAAHRREMRFTSDVSHELRTPLTALMTSASMANEHLDQMAPAARWYTEQMIKQATRLRHLVDELMEISRLDSGRESVSREPVDVGELVAMLVSSRSWNDDVSLEAEEVPVSTDRRRLERIVANLIGNAIDHGKENVRVRAAKDGTNFLVEVMDNGPGIPPEHLPHIFDRFYKVDPARSGGSGLGLSIAMENAKLLGGTIDVSSTPESGTRFVVRLPVTAQLLNCDAAVAAKRQSV